MRKIICIIFCVSFINCFSQKGIVYYGYIEALGMGNAKGSDSNAYMIFNKEQSYYVTAKDSLENDINKNEQKIFKNDEGGGSIYNGLKVSPQGDQVAYHIKKHTMWSNILYVSQIYVKEIAPEQKWKIEKETKKIGKFSCKKATAFFRGRNYTAWFTTEIPLPFGPWKLNGLPGLILEAYDTNKNVYWYFKSVEYPSNTKEKTKYLSLTKKEKFKTYEDFIAFKNEQQQKVKDKSILMKKQFPEIQVELPKLNEMFIENE